MARKRAIKLVQNKQLLTVVGLPLVADMIRFMFANESRTAMSVTKPCRSQVPRISTQSIWLHA